MEPENTTPENMEGAAAANPMPENMEVKPEGEAAAPEAPATETPTTDAPAA